MASEQRNPDGLEKPENSNISGENSNSPAGRETPSRRSSRRAKVVAQTNMRANSGSYGPLCKYKGNMGRWKVEEHVQFIVGLRRHGKNWKLVERHVTSRSGPQIRSHAQKFFKRIQLNCRKDETPIECLKRTNFSVEVILSGIEESDDKSDNALELRQKLQQNFPECDCEEFRKILNNQGSSKSKKSMCDDEQSGNSPHAPESQDGYLPEDFSPDGVNQKSPGTRDIKKNGDGSQQIDERKFSYFPSSYKMSTTHEMNHKKQAPSVMTSETPSVIGAVMEPQDPCIQLQSLEDFPQKRKHSEMIRLDKLDKSESVRFHIPNPKEQTELAGKKRVNKLMAKYKRNRIMTESPMDSKIGFLPTKSSSQTMNRIQRLRSKDFPKPTIGQCLMSQGHKWSTDDTSPNLTLPSSGSKKVSVVLIKKDQDLREACLKFNRNRFQTY